jgi:hypothetical protein
MKTALDPPRGCPVWGGDVHRIRVIIILFEILSKYTVPIHNSEGPSPIGRIEKKIE